MDVLGSHYMIDFKASHRLSILFTWPHSTWLWAAW